MGTVAEKLAYLKDTTDLLKSVCKEAGITIPEEATLRDYVALIQEFISEPATYTLLNQDGSQITAVEFDEEVVFTATANDIREGTVAATARGVTPGTAVIPAYHTIEGYCLIESGSKFAIPFANQMYGFTKLQAIICPWNGSLEGSVAAEKVSIDENVYAVGSAEPIAAVARDSTNQEIDLGITNESESLYLIRYFMYKEIV